MNGILGTNQSSAEIDASIIENAKKLIDQFGVVDTYIGIYDAYTSKSNDEVTKGNGLEIEKVVRILNDGYVDDYNREAGKGGVFPGWMKEEYDRAVFDSERYISLFINELNMTYKTL